MPSERTHKEQCASRKMLQLFLISTPKWSGRANCPNTSGRSVFLVFFYQMRINDGWEDHSSPPAPALGAQRKRFADRFNSQPKLTHRWPGSGHHPAPASTFADNSASTTSRTALSDSLAFSAAPASLLRRRVPDCGIVPRLKETR